MFTSHALRRRIIFSFFIGTYSSLTYCTLLVPYEHSTPQSCQHYKPHYVQMARDVQATEEGKNVQFHAIPALSIKTFVNKKEYEGIHRSNFTGMGIPLGLYRDEVGDFSRSTKYLQNWV